MNRQLERFEDAYRRAKPGYPLVYHTGNLMCDRNFDNGVATVAERVWSLYETGKVHLLQRRVQNGPLSCCLYLAIKKGKKNVSS